ncbi:MAG TPA: methyltransferase domain-containing protein [Acidobacteriota bacterium]
MASIFWTGKLTWPMWLMVNANNILAWLRGKTRDHISMKSRVRKGYEGAFTDHVTRYDMLSREFQVKAARAQLEDLELRDRGVLDVGGGTGIISFLALERGARKVVCSDISEYMLEQGKKKAKALGLGPGRIEFKTMDAEALPIADSSFDVVLTGMTLGLLPDQPRAVAEMVRVLRPGGLISVGAHGPEHYWEAIDVCFREVTKRYVLGTRMEFWPRTERAVKRMVERAGIKDVRMKRVIWRNVFEKGGQAFDFFSAVTSAWWYASFPQDKISENVKRTRDHFEKKRIVTVTDDVIYAVGVKPATLIRTSS